MPDKFRNTYPISISFASGEQPTSTKLNSISSQSKNGLALIEKAIGDLWNQSGDSITANYPLQITNIARQLGQQNLLTAELPYPDFTGTTSVRIKQSITEFEGKTEILLDFEPENDATLQASVQALLNSDNNTYTGSSLSLTSINTNTEWGVSTSDGKVYLGQALNTTQTVSYIEYNVAADNFPSDASGINSFSVIPHPGQAFFQGLKVVAVSANKYCLVLPYRRPPVGSTTADKSPSATTNSVENSAPTVVRYWGPSATGFTSEATIRASRFYRYTLGKIITDMFTSPTSGATIPAGTVYLWDNDTDSIVEGLTFKVPETPLSFFSASQLPFIIQVEGVGLDSLFSGETSSNSSEAESHYRPRFSLITVGQSLAESIQKLRRQLTEGNWATAYASRITHADLKDLNPAEDGARVSLAPTPSYVPGDDHVYLLSRLGSVSSSSNYRDRYNNGMLGNLLFPRASSNTNNLLGSSHRIIFGHYDDGPELYYSLSVLSSITGITETTTSDVLTDGSALALTKFPLYLEKRTLLMGTSGDGLTYSQSSKLFRFFSDDDVNGAQLAAGGIYLYQSAYDIDVVQNTGGSPNPTAEDLGIWSKVANNTLTFKGSNFDLSNSTNTVGPTATNFVITVGTGNSNTHLRLINNQLHFTDSSNRIIFNSDIFTFTSTGTTIVASEILRTTDNQVQFTDANSYLSYVSDVFTFTSPSIGLNVTSVNSEVFNATANEYRFNGSANSRVVHSSDVYTYYAADGTDINANLGSGSLFTTNNLIRFGSSSLLNNTLTYLSDVYTFQSVSVGATVVSSDKFRATQDIYEFSNNNYRIEKSSNTYSFFAVNVTSSIIKVGTLETSTIDNLTGSSITVESNLIINGTANFNGATATASNTALTNELTKELLPKAWAIINITSATAASFVTGMNIDTASIVIDNANNELEVDLKVNILEPCIMATWGYSPGSIFLGYGALNARKVPFTNTIAITSTIANDFDNDFPKQIYFLVFGKI